MLQEGGGGIKLVKSSKRAQKWNFFEINNLFDILNPFSAINSGF